MQWENGKVNDQAAEKVQSEQKMFYEVNPAGI